LEFPPLLCAGCQFRLLDLHLDLSEPGSDGVEEGLEVEEEVLFCDPGVPIQEVQHLPLHQVDLGQRKPEAVVSLDAAIVCPVLVLRTRVVEVLGCEDEGGEKYSVDGATHALCYWWKTGLETSEVHEGAHERGDLDLGSVDEGGDEGFEGRQRRESSYLPGFFVQRGS
jgi:hypothetical protein